MNARNVKQKYGVAVGSRLNHPLYGIGEIQKIAEQLEVRWENPYHRIKAPVHLDEADLQYMTKVISEEKKMSKTKKKVLEFDLPDASDAILTGTDKMPNGASAPLGTMDGNAGANKNWSPSVMKNMDGELGDVKVASVGGKGASATAKKSSPAPKSETSESEPKESAPRGDGESDFDYQKRKVSEMDISWSDLTSLSGLSESESEEEEEDDNDADDVLDECGEDQMNTKIKEHDMAAGEIAITKELFMAVVQAAIKDQPDDAAVTKMADAFASCCGDRTLDVSDIGEIMAVARGEGASADEGPSEVEDVAPADGDVAGDEGGEEHEGKKMLMAGQFGESKKTDDKKKKKADDKEEKKKDDEKKKDKKKINEAWLARKPIPNTSVIGIGSDRSTEIVESDDEDTIFLKQIAARAGVKYRG